MGIYLKLLPLYGTESLTKGEVRCECVLPLDQNYDSFAQLSPTFRDSEERRRFPMIQSRPIPVQLWVHGPARKEKTRTDAYGCELTFLYANELRELQVEDGDFWNKAIMAFINALPGNTPIILFWH